MDSVKDKIENFVRNSVCFSVWNSVDNSVWDSVWNSVGISVSNSIWNSVRNYINIKNLKLSQVESVYDQLGE